MILVLDIYALIASFMAIVGVAIVVTIVKNKKIKKSKTKEIDDNGDIPTDI